MPDWLRQTLGNGVPESWEPLTVRLVTALILGSAVTGIHRATRGRSTGPSSTFPATLVLLCVLIAMVTQVIGDNVARAFSLVGALSIVRFRTVLRDTKDTAFVIFAVVVGMAVGAGQPLVAVLGMVAFTIAAAIHHDRPHDDLAAPLLNLLAVKLAWTPELETQLRGVLSKHTSDMQSLTAGTIRQGSAMELTYRIALLPTASLPQLVSDLNRIEGVLAAEVRPENREA
ncbi:MAG: DUF4956 domain-containing protein [Planctomycetaceae bacterium]|nr:DUF4956 domain-containing protein [Planctomycetaceae bacterium]